MTDAAMADHVYVEPLTLDFLKKSSKKNTQTASFSTLGGQTGLTLSMQLAKGRLSGTGGRYTSWRKPETIAKAEDRQVFKSTMEAIREPIIPSVVTTTLLRVPSPSRTLQAIRLSCVPPSPSAAPEAASLQTRHSCAKLLPQGSVFPRSRRFWWKNVSPAGKRSNLRSCATAMETSSRSALWKIFDPVGVHTGDSIVIAPCGHASG